MISLDIYHNPLVSLPEEIGNLQNLETLNARSSNLSCLPDTLEHLTNLKTLALYETQLNYLPEGIGKLKKLTFLNLSDTPLSQMPCTIGNNINKINIISLKGCNQIKLPNEHGYLTFSPMTPYYRKYLMSSYLKTRWNNFKKIFLMFKSLAYNNIFLPTPITGIVATYLNDTIKISQRGYNVLKESVERELKAKKVPPALYEQVTSAEKFFWKSKSKNTQKATSSSSNTSNLLM